MQFVDKIYVTVDQTPDMVRKKYMDCKFHEILADIVAIGSEANNYIDTQSPVETKENR